MPTKPTPSKTLKQHLGDKPHDYQPSKGADIEDCQLADPTNPTQQEQSLWRAVIVQMLTDALSNSRKPDNIRYRKEARHWLTSYSRDFRLVCEYAGFDPKWMQEVISRFLQDNRSVSALDVKNSPADPPDRQKPVRFSITYRPQDCPTLSGSLAQGISAMNTPKTRQS